MSHIDVCLVSPHKRIYNHHRLPLALIFITSFLERNGIKTKIVDPHSETDVIGPQKTIIVSYILQQIIKSKRKTDYFLGVKNLIKKDYKRITLR